MNYVALLGNLTADPQSHTFPSGNSVVRFSIAVNDFYVDKKTGEKVNNATFVDCEAWGGLGEKILDRFTKGTKVLLSGQLKQSKWQDKEGNPRTKLFISCKTAMAVNPVAGNAEPLDEGVSVSEDVTSEVQF